MKKLINPRLFMAVFAIIGFITLLVKYGPDKNIQTLIKYGRVDTSQPGRLIYFDSDNYESPEEHDALLNLKRDYTVFYLQTKYDY